MAIHIKGSPSRMEFTGKDAQWLVIGAAFAGSTPEAFMKWIKGCAVSRARFLLKTRKGR